MPDCKKCSNKDWKNHYIMAQQRFDKQIVRLTLTTALSFVIMVICLIATLITIIKFQMFIEQFEYVEETEIQIEQDCRGQNTVILSDGTEVKANGTEVHRDEEKVLEKENTKINTITVGR